MNKVSLYTTGRHRVGDACTNRFVAQFAMNKLTLFIAIQFIGPHRKQDADIAESERIFENAGFIAAPRV